jgi:tyrosyl-tRNA synthetase
MLLRRLKEAGHTIILLVGGGTGMIGDPKPDVERPLTPPEVVAERVKKLSAQAKQLLGDGVIFVNNHDWLGELKLIDFLRDTGKHFTVNELIKKDAIATRLSGEHGISYTEFAYPLLQGFDFLELYRKHNCTVQVGGSDQWGNIIAGVELVRKKEQQTVYAVTIPLIIDKTTGKKFGKSEGNAVWLDAEKTSPFSFYQFWLNVSDDNVFDYIKIFTTRPLIEVADIESAHKATPEKRIAQKILAEDITTIVHGAETAESCIKVSEVIFGGGSLKDLHDTERTLLTSQAPTTKVTEGQAVVDVLVEVSLASSKREARLFIEEGAVTLGEEKVTEIDAVINQTQFHQDVTLLRRGKKHVHVLRL